MYTFSQFSQLGKETLFNNRIDEFSNNIYYL